MKVAAVQMKAVLGDVAVNLKKARALGRSSHPGRGPVVILPEFFLPRPPGSQKCIMGPSPDGAAMDLLTSLCPDP
ncbi:MAG: hypothetical protein R2860_14230 [Desulfobacterales bacterium]